MADGIVIIDKPQDWTSFDVVAKLRRIFNTKKIGHTGTLDPMATGVLCVFLGSATKFIPLLPRKDKRYTAEVTFGIQTDTGDITGTITHRSEIIPTREQLCEILPSFTGEISQIPPAYSAVKVNGRALYKSARNGEAVSAPPRQVCIHLLEMTRVVDGVATLDILCSEGTYIRTLAEDIAKQLGTVATLSALRRTESGQFKLDSALTLDEVINNPTPERLLMTVESGFFGLERIDVDEVRLKRLGDGLTQKVQGVKALTRVYHNDRFAGLITGDGEIIKAVRMCQY